MAKEVIMPVFGFNQEDSQIVAWLAKEGDAVTQGDPIAEVTTDKINMEIEAPATGILGGIQYTKGETVPVTTVIAYILQPGEAAPPAPKKETSPAKEEAAVKVKEEPKPVMQPVSAPIRQTATQAGFVTPVAARVLSESGIDPDRISGTGMGGRITRRDVENFLQAGIKAPTGKVRATPAARRVAREKGIDLRAIRGSGPHGRVQSDDVRQPVAFRTADPMPAAGQVKRIPFSQMRRTIASNLQRSAQEAPHIYFQSDTDMTALSDMVVEGNRHKKEGDPKVTLTAVLAKIVAWTLVRHPRVNSHLEGESILEYADVDLGIAVALDDGLIVPVIHSANHKNIQALSTEMFDLSQRARTGRLRPDDLKGATFTISNLGMFGIDRFTAIINPPQVAILAIGRAARKLVPDEYGRPVVRQIATLTLSVDHRAVDGAVAAEFMDELKTVCEKPQLMSL